MLDAKKNIGFFGGSFDPIHNGHINLVFELMEKCHLDEVWFSPVFVSPHKLQFYPIGTVKRRLEMLHLALDGIKEFKILDEEIKTERPSYTIKIFRKLIERRENKNFTFHLLLAEDVAMDLDRWKEAEALLDLIPVLIGSRLENKKSIFSNNQKLNQLITNGLVKTNLMDISSSDLRMRLSNRLFCGHLMPAKVLDYIYTHKLYFHVSDDSKN